MTPQRELDRMNVKILYMQRQRLAWMKENYLLFAEFRIGDRIYAKVAANDYKLQFAGVVNRVYLTSGVESTTVDVHYAFDRAEGYNYSGDTEGGWAHYYNQAYAERETQGEIDRLLKEVHPEV